MTPDNISPSPHPGMSQQQGVTSRRQAIIDSTQSDRPQPGTDRSGSKLRHAFRTVGNAVIDIVSLCAAVKIRDNAATNRQVEEEYAMCVQRSTAECRALCEELWRLHSSPTDLSRVLRENASIPVWRAGLVLTKIVAWHTRLPASSAKDVLFDIARELVEYTHSELFSPTAHQLIADLPKIDGNCGPFPWTEDELDELKGIIGSRYRPVRMELDAQALGARVLAGLVIADLWMEPVLQRTEGPKDYLGVPPPLAMPIKPGTLSAQAMAAELRICIDRLATCQSVDDIKTSLIASLVPFEKLPSGKLAHVDRLRSALTKVEAKKEHVSTMGGQLLHPPHTAPWPEVHVNNRDALAA